MAVVEFFLIETKAFQRRRAFRVIPRVRKQYASHIPKKSANVHRFPAFDGYANAIDCNKIVHRGSAISLRFPHARVFVAEPIRQISRGKKFVARKTAPIRGAGPGRLLLQLQTLLTREVLVITQADHVLEHGRARRQIVRVQELGVEEVVSVRRSVHHIAALEHPSVVLRIVHADQRANVVHSATVSVVASVLEIAQEVVHTSVRTEILHRDSIGPARLRKRNALAGGYGHPIITGVSWPIVWKGGGHSARALEALGIGPPYVRCWECGG